MFPSVQQLPSEDLAELSLLVGLNSIYYGFGNQ